MLPAVRKKAELVKKSDEEITSLKELHDQHWLGNNTRSTFWQLTTSSGVIFGGLISGVDAALIPTMAIGVSSMFGWMIVRGEEIHFNPANKPLLYGRMLRRRIRKMEKAYGWRPIAFMPHPKGRNDWFDRYLPVVEAVENNGSLVYRVHLQQWTYAQDSKTKNQPLWKLCVSHPVGDFDSIDQAATMQSRLLDMQSTTEALMSHIEYPYQRQESPLVQKRTIPAVSICHTFDQSLQYVLYLQQWTSDGRCWNNYQSAENYALAKINGAQFFDDETKLAEAFHDLAIKHENTALPLKNMQDEVKALNAAVRRT